MTKVIEMKKVKKFSMPKVTLKNYRITCSLFFSGSNGDVISTLVPVGKYFLEEVIHLVRMQNFPKN